MGGAMVDIQDSLAEKKRIKDKERANAGKGWGMGKQLMEKMENKFTSALVLSLAEKKVIAEIQKTKLQLEKDVMTDNIQNEVNYSLLRMFDYLDKPEPKCEMKYESF